MYGLDSSPKVFLLIGEFAEDSETICTETDT